MARWEFYRTADGRRVVAEEVKAFPLDARGLAKWNQLLTAIANGAAKPGRDFKVFKGSNKGLREARLKFNGIAFRLIYSVEDDGRPLLLAVRGFLKKTPKTPPNHLDVARSRREEWRARRTR
jgi:phage-related protein